MRRVGVGVLAAASLRPFQIGPVVLGPLAGRHQSVPRGELRGLELAIRLSLGDLVYVADNDEVSRGWASR
eukprot:2955571-Pyramimonas_sp.AAC.1